MWKEIKKICNFPIFALPMAFPWGSLTGGLAIAPLRILLRSPRRPLENGVIPKILRYSFIVLVLLTNRKDYEHFIE